MYRPLANCAIVLTLLTIGAGCGGSDAPGTTGVPATNAPDGDAATAPAAEPSSGEIAFGEVIEGSFLVSGAIDAQFYVSDDALGFRSVGGCQDGAFGFGVQVQDAAATKTFAMFGVEGPLDLSGGATGEYDDVEGDVTVFPDGNTTVFDSYTGPIKMVISEHDTGGATADLNARRMTVTLLGTIEGDDGSIDVDVTYRWVMGCP